MEIALQLAESIGGLFIFILVGFIFVKIKLVKSVDAKTISKILMFLSTPAAVLHAFQIEFTADRLLDLGLSFFGGLLCQLLFMGISLLLKKTGKLSNVERMSIAYPNTANLTIPLVTATLGGDWVLFTAGYSVIQNIFVWIHESPILSGQKANFKKIILNVNIICIILGILLFLLQVPIPEFFEEACSLGATTLGPLSMFMIGMSIASISIKEIFQHRNLYLVLILRLLVCPIIIALILRFSGILAFSPNAETVFLITLLGAAGPVSATTVQFSQLYDQEPAYAGALNLTSTLCCILTIPLMVILYQFLLAI